MALRLRRGTDAERLLITPVEGELIYTTDTKLLYVGDGTTVGGIIATGQGGTSDGSLAGLSDTAVAGVTDGQQIVWNAGLGRWVPADKTLESLNDVVAAGATDGQVLTWDNGISTWVASNPTGGASELSQLSDVDTLGVTTSDLLQYDGVEWVAKSVDEVLLDVNYFNGSITGDVVGSVYGDDSVIIIDGQTHALYTDGLIFEDRSISDKSLYGNVEIGAGPREPVRIQSVTSGNLGGFPYVDFSSVKGSLEVPQDSVAGDYIGGWKISAYKAGLDGTLNAVTATARFEPSANMADTSPASSLNILTGAGGTDFNIFTMDNIGQFKAPGPVTPGTYADPTARDAAITAPAAGMIVFLTDSTGAGGAPKHQGYDGSSWNDLY